jgi:hypothetical protein
MDESLTPTDKGNIAETAVVAHATRLGIAVLRPVQEGLRYDLAFDLGELFVRVQCKWATLHGDVVRIHSRTSRVTTAGHVRGTYSADEIDAVAGYCAALDRVYLLPIAEVAGKSMTHLRLAPAKNNQAINVHWAARYELGAIAQLGERLRGTQEVAGSSPASSMGPKAA